MYFYFQHKSLTNQCDQTVRIFGEVLFYFNFVGMCLQVCLICCTVSLSYALAGSTATQSNRRFVRMYV